ncbi:protein of unknown function [Magnetospirillum sp. XM-1]|nr:protein of unknown function [Magnetospirillum sp. XM-1]
MGHPILVRPKGPRGLCRKRQGRKAPARRLRAAHGKSEPPFCVMAGLDPAIHVEPFGTIPDETTWMPGTSPRMTSEKCGANSGSAGQSDRKFSHR